MLESVITAIPLKVLDLPAKTAPLVLGCKTLPETKALRTDKFDEALSKLSQLDVAQLYRSGADG